MTMFINSDKDVIIAKFKKVVPLEMELMKDTQRKDNTTTSITFIKVLFK